jgi:hypothetical protein
MRTAPTPPPANWWDTFTIGGTVEAGVTLNGDNPTDGLNFGHLFTDKANLPLLNQILLTAQRPLDPKATDYDFGFKVQLMYGSDARYTHFLGEGEYWINGLYQFTPVEAFAIAHLPWLFAGGIDVKAGQFVTLEGAETIDPTTNYLYSHSYIFNFGIPLVHTGVMSISHVDPLVDIYAGITSGVNTTFGGVNVARPAFHGGIARQSPRKTNSCTVRGNFGVYSRQVIPRRRRKTRHSARSFQEMVAKEPIGLRIPKEVRAALEKLAAMALAGALR